MACKQLQCEASEFASATTIHGVAELFSGQSRWLRAVWGLIMLASACGCAFHLYGTVKDYIEKPTATTSSITPLSDFPVFTIHVLNAINSSKIREFNLNDDHTRFILSRFGMAEVQEWSPSEEFAKKLRMEVEQAQQQRGLGDFTEFVRALAFEPQKLLGTFQGSTANISISINELGPSYKFTVNCCEEQRPPGSKTDMQSLTSWGTWVTVGPLATMTGKTPERGNLRKATPVYISFGEDIYDTNRWISLTQAQNYFLRVEKRKIIDRPSRPCSKGYQIRAYCLGTCILRNKRKPDADCEWYSGQANETRLCDGILDSTSIPTEKVTQAKRECVKAGPTLR